MGRLTSGIGVLFLLTSAIGSAQQDQKPPPVDQVKVDEAIKKGIAFLKKNFDLPKDPKFPRRPGAEHSLELVLFTLIHSGLDENDKYFAKLLDYMLKEKLMYTYNVALQAMILEELDRVTYQWRLAQCAQFLVDNQADNGQWSYGDPSAFVEDLPTGRRKRKDVATTSKNRRKTTTDGDGRRPKPKIRRRIPIKQRRPGPATGDNSNSQYAALGLRACHDGGIVIDKKILARGQQWWERSQKKDGGWCYANHGRHESYGSMSAGALGALVIYRYMNGKKWRKDRKVGKGLEWLTANFSVEKNTGTPEHGGGKPTYQYYYYLYALERACVLYGTERLGKNWWYSKGVDVLLKKQNANGSWSGSSFARWDTCFAILFLRRATRPLEAVKTGGGRKRDR